MRQILVSSAVRLSVLLGGGIAGSVAATALFYASPALGAVLDAWSYDADTQQLSVTLPQGVIPRYLVFAEPARIVLEIPRTQAGQVQEQAAYDGQVRSIQLSQHSSDTVRIVMVLAPGTRLDPRHARLSSAPINGQVRWTLTPLLVDGSAIAQPAPNSTPANLPPLPSAAVEVLPNAPIATAPEAPVDPTTSAASLILPTAEHDLSALPSALPGDPRATGQNTNQQVRVPDLDDTVATVPPATAAPPVAPTPPQTSSVTAIAPQSPQAVAPAVAPETTGAIATAPPGGSQPVPQQATSLAGASPVADLSAADSTPMLAAPESAEPSIAIPPSTPGAVTPPIAVEPPGELPLSVPAAPTTAGTITAAPPAPMIQAQSSTPANSVIAFGQPLPQAAGKALDGRDPDRSIPALTDVLLPAGALLQLRYPGDTPITVDRHATGQTTLVLEADLRDGANRLVAPAGSQMIGRFEPTPTGQRWISDTLVLSGGQVALTTTSDYLASAPEVSAGSLALNSGIGALAVAIITGFTGLGLIGGAVVGATTAVGTAPQTIVIQPNEIIEVRVLSEVTYAALDWSNPEPVGNVPSIPD